MSMRDSADNPTTVPDAVCPDTSSALCFIAASPRECIRSAKSRSLHPRPCFAGCRRWCERHSGTPWCSCPPLTTARTAAHERERTRWIAHAGSRRRPCDTARDKRPRTAQDHHGASATGRGGRTGAGTAPIQLDRITEQQSQLQHRGGPSNHNLHSGRNSDRPDL